MKNHNTKNKYKQQRFIERPNSSLALLSLYLDKMPESPKNWCLGRPGLLKNGF